MRSGTSRRGNESQRKTIPWRMKFLICWKADIVEPRVALSRADTYSSTAYGYCCPSISGCCWLGAVVCLATESRRGSRAKDMDNGLLTSEGKRWCFAGPSKATNRRSRGGCANQEKDDGVGLKARNGGRGGWEGQNGLKRNGRPGFRLHVTKNQQHGRERVKC